MNRNYLKATLAMLAGTVLIVLGDCLLGVRIEIFEGIATFTLPWIIAVFLVPFISGYVVAKIYAEKGGKWFACLPPLIVRTGAVLYLYFTDPLWNEDFFYHLHLHYWGLCVILVVEAANLGGVLGEFNLNAYLRNDELRGKKSDSNRQLEGENP